MTLSEYIKMQAAIQYQIAKFKASDEGRCLPEETSIHFEVHESGGMLLMWDTGCRSIASSDFVTQK